MRKPFSSLDRRLIKKRPLRCYWFRSTNIAINASVQFIVGLHIYFFAIPPHLRPTSALTTLVSSVLSLGSSLVHDATVWLGHRILRLKCLVTSWRHPICRVVRPRLFLPCSFSSILVSVPISRFFPYTCTCLRSRPRPRSRHRSLPPAPL